MCIRNTYNLNCHLYGEREVRQMVMVISTEINPYYFLLDIINNDLSLALAHLVFVFETFVHSRKSVIATKGAVSNGPLKWLFFLPYG